MAENTKYSQWLVASDIDGTLNTKMRKLPQNNLDAINDFIDKGGHFTLASGRNPESMRRHYKKLPISIPAIVMNGAGIYDFQKEEMIYFNPISEKAMEDVCKLARTCPTIDTLIVAKDIVYITGVGLWGKIYALVDGVTHKYYRNINDAPKKDWGKVIFSGPPWRVRGLKKKFQQIEDPDFLLMDSSIATFELLAKGVHKGTSVLQLAKMLGVDKKNTAAIGDYYNDYDMLKSVGVPACCGQAPKSLKAVCEYVTCHCNEGAVADLLGYLEREKINK